jgi:hypothetical protein
VHASIVHASDFFFFISVSVSSELVIQFGLGRRGLG